MAVHSAKTDALAVQAPNGVVWTRKPEGRSSASDLLRELADLVKDHIEREWDWWEEGRSEKEHERRWAVLGEWDNGARAPSGSDPDRAAKACMEDFDRRMVEQRREREVLAAERYDKERESMRLRMLSAEADAAFFGHVLARPATTAQRDKAEQRMEQQRAVAVAMHEQLGDPEDVVDRDGFFPAQRREMNLSSHMSVWRHPMLRGLHKASSASGSTLCWRCVRSTLPRCARSARRPHSGIRTRCRCVCSGGGRSQALRRKRLQG